MAKQTLNAVSSPTLPATSTGAIRSDPNTGRPSSSPGAPDDNVLAAKAKDQAAHGNHSGASQTAASIKDTQKRIETQHAIGSGTDGGTNVDTPVSLVQDGSGGLSDPLALFFMMVFYLKEATPTFKWDDVLKTAAAFSNQDFSAIVPNAALLPQRTYQDSGTAKAGTGIKGSVSANSNAIRESLAKKNNAIANDTQHQRDAVKTPLNATMGSASSGSAGNSAPVVVWPIQCMPIISGGLNKTVDWPNNQVATLAEPTIALNKGGSAIEIDIEFTYAVGVYGVGDAEITAMTANVDPNTGTPTDPTAPANPPDKEGKWWTIEEVMGMMYLATSLVYPFKSSPVVSSPSDTTTPPVTDKRTSAQFPVIFLRHYSLFPFLTPFVVKGVKIEPDENQPLVITEAKNLNKQFKTHLTYPAVRQVVKITLSLVSAHYYLPIFGGKDAGNQIQNQTSGETYLELSKSLLQDRIA